MQGLLAVFLFILPSNTVVKAFDTKEIQQDLINFNITCVRENCAEYQLDSFVNKDCHCGISCVRYGTCCLDSLYANVPQPELKPACRTVLRGDYYFIVDQCSSTDSVWASLCNGEFESDDDIRKFVPVTSLFTSITYKNYYCFRCHETSDEFLYWKIKIESVYAQSSDSFGNATQYENFSLIYNKTMNTWMAIYDENVDYFEVLLSVIVPDEAWELVHECVPNVISNCSDKWYDEQVRDRCHSYMAMKTVKKEAIFKYKNIHCALCNFEDLNDIICRQRDGSNMDGTFAFSFTHLLDINRSDGELVGKIQKCNDDHLWDPISKKCRKLSCALPDKKLKDGKCV